MMKTFRKWNLAIVSVLLTVSSICVFADKEADAISEEENLLEEIVAIREDTFERQKLLKEEGHVLDLLPARLVLLNARIDLAKEKGELATAIAHLEEVAVLYRDLEKSHQLEAEIGKGNSKDLADAKINFLKTRLKIVRLKKSIAEESKN